MCQPKPGPRCSAHARDRFDKLGNARLKAELAYISAQQNLDKVEKEVTGTRDVVAARLALTEAHEHLIETTEKFAEARKDWYSTPEGQKFLETRLEGDALSESERERVAAELDEGRATRERQMRAWNLVSAARQRLEDLDHDSEGYRDIQDARDALEAADDTLVATNERIIGLSKAHNDAVAARDEAMGELRARLSRVTDAHQALARKVRDTYVSFGVPRELANHYANDTVAAFQEGYAYLSEDSTNRTPWFNSTLNVKQKSDVPLTWHAKEAMENTDVLADEMRSVQVAHASYNAAIDSAQKAHARAIEARSALSDAINDRDDLLDLRHKRQADLFHAQARVSSGSVGTVDYLVAPAQFIKSVYVNPDGSTNGSVLDMTATAGTPVYVGITEVGSDSRGRYVATELGERLYGDDLRARKAQLRLIDPQEGAVRAISKEN